MDEWQNERLTDAELHALVDRLLPHGFTGADVLAEIAPDGWEQSPLLACFHPSVERVSVTCGPSRPTRESRCDE